MYDFWFLRFDFIHFFFKIRKYSFLSVHQHAQLNIIIQILLLLKSDSNSKSASWTWSHLYRYIPLIIYKRAIKGGGNSPSYKRLAPEREKGRHHRFFCRSREAAESRTNRHHPRCNRNNNNYNPFDDFSSLSTDSLYNVNATGNCWQKIRCTEFRYCGVERINNDHRNRILELRTVFLNLLANFF